VRPLPQNDGIPWPLSASTTRSPDGTARHRCDRPLAQAAGRARRPGPEFLARQPAEETGGARGDAPSAAATPMIPRHTSRYVTASTPRKPPRAAPPRSAQARRDAKMDCPSDDQRECSCAHEDSRIVLLQSIRPFAVVTPIRHDQKTYAPC